VSKYRLELLDDRGLRLSNAGIFDTVAAAEAYAHGIGLTCNWRVCVEWTLKEKYADMHMTEMMFRDEYEHDDAPENGDAVTDTTAKP
jgi:hypothetical protein